MSHHTCKPGHPGILADDCPRCDEHARDPYLLSLDEHKAREVWDKMIAVEFNADGSYATGNEARACESMHRLGIWLERNVGVRPWVTLAALRARLTAR